MSKVGTGTRTDTELFAGFESLSVTVTAPVNWMVLPKYGLFAADMIRRDF